MQNKRYLLTGGASMIGSHIVNLLVQEDPAEVVIFDNFIRGRRENLAKAKERGPVTIIEGDIRDRAALAEAMQGIDIVFHLAAIRITMCAEEPRIARRGPRRWHIQRAGGGDSQHKVQ